MIGKGMAKWQRTEQWTDIDCDLHQSHGHTEELREDVTLGFLKTVAGAVVIVDGSTAVSDG